MAADVLTQRAQVLVIGTGGAGLRAAIAAVEAGADVLVVAKRGRADAHTVMAAGGINAALGTVDPEDSWQQHFADTVRESYGLAHPKVAEILTREAPAAIQELVDWGCAFARTPDGELDQRYFGAHRYRRTCYAGDHTGRDIIDALVRRAEALEVPFVEHTYVTRLLVEDGRCAGAFGFDLRTGEQTAFLAGAVVLGTGGHTSLWHRNTSRADENWGEGIALALSAGAELMDMELVQFHPTGLVSPEDIAGTLVTEAVRGEGGILTNALGERFMARYDPERMELSTRDRVALANYTEILEGRGGPHGGVFLDVSHRGLDHIQERLPKMYRQLLAFQGVDISKEPMEVAPTAHYSMGGIAVEPETPATTVPGLFAAGECASGLHGANRLGGNSLVDILVFGRRAGTEAARIAGQGGAGVGGGRAAGAAVADAAGELDALLAAGEGSPKELQNMLRSLMWERCGVVRTEAGLLVCLEELAGLSEAAGAMGVNGDGEPWNRLAHGMDLRFGLMTAEATVRGALARRETRGAHNRSDFPALDPALTVNLHQRRGGEGFEVWAEPVPAVPDDLAPWLEGEAGVPGVRD